MTIYVDVDATKTMQDVLDEARLSLNDDDKQRNADSATIVYANEAIAITYKLRPDLRFGAYTSEYAPLTADDFFPLPFQYTSVIEDYIRFRCEMRDDEAVSEGLASGYNQLFEQRVMAI